MRISEVEKQAMNDIEQAMVEKILDYSKGKMDDPSLLHNGIYGIIRSRCEVMLVGIEHQIIENDPALEHKKKVVAILKVALSMGDRSCIAIGSKFRRLALNALLHGPLSHIDEETMFNEDESMACNSGQFIQIHDAKFVAMARALELMVEMLFNWLSKAMDDLETLHKVNMVRADTQSLRGLRPRDIRHY